MLSVNTNRSWMWQKEQTLNLSNMQRRNQLRASSIHEFHSWKRVGLMGGALFWCKTCSTYIHRHYRIQHFMSFFLAGYWPSNSLKITTNSEDITGRCEKIPCFTDEDTKHDIPGLSECLTSAATSTEPLTEILLVLLPYHLVMSLL